MAQSVLLERILPRARTEGIRHRKFQRVQARPARPGEVVVSITTDGEETTNTAGPDKMRVRNLTEAQEEYLVGKQKFAERYSLLETLEDGWAEYEPKGEILGVEITRDVTDLLDVGEEFFIMAPWGSEQLAREGDLFVAPLPRLDEIYRIARKEFDETYKPVAAD